MASALGPVGTHEALPEYGNSVTLVGDPASLWTDANDDTYTDMFGNGFGHPWGHPYAEVPDLTLTSEAAADVTDITLRWRIRLVPGVEIPAEPTVVPYLTVEPASEGTNFVGLSLESNDWAGDGDYTVMIVGTEWAWHETTMLSFAAEWPTTQDFLADTRPKYVAFLINSSWQDEHFQISEVEVVVNGLVLPQIAYRRTFPSDAATEGARRTSPPSKALQAGRRTSGAFL